MLLYAIHKKQAAFIIIDVIIVFLSYLLAGTIIAYPRLSLDGFVPDYTCLSVIIAAYILCYYFFQVYRVIWRYASRSDYFKLLWSNSVIASGLLIVSGYAIIPYLKIEILLAYYFIISLGIASRMFVGSRLFVPLRTKGDAERTVIIGAGTAGRMIMSEFNRRKTGKSVIGFLDDDTGKTGKICNGKLVIGTTKKIREIILKYDVTSFIFAMPSVNHQYIKHIVDKIRQVDAGITIQELPPITKIFDDVPLLPDLIDIGLADLGGREDFLLNMDSIEKAYKGAVVLVTGAGGSIGSELCHQLLKFGVKRIIAIGRGENSIYDLAKSLNLVADYYEDKADLVYRICDVKNMEYMEHIFQTLSPDIVFHAAAHKHVPLMEDNEVEALHNNVAGTRNVLELSVRHAVKNFVLISTDKAVYPENIMGASKRIAELLAFQYHQQKQLHISVVRFGNVIGSRGSVVPLFKEQIERGGPITITHPEMKRFFMTITEAALLVVNAASLNETGELYVLDMGQQYKIIDIARSMVESYGLVLDRDIKVECIGLRPGEKLDEKLHYDYETIKRTSNSKIMSILIEQYPVSTEKLTDLLWHLENDNRKKLYENNKQELRALVRAIVPEFTAET